MKNGSGLAYEETSLLFPHLPNPVILDVASTQPHHLDAIISEPRVMFDGQQQLRGELLRPGWSEPALRYLVSVFSFYLPFLSF
jgi:hypothetical protein